MQPDVNLSLITAIYTLMGAVILFGFSELVRGFIIGPALKIREHVGLIIDKVIFFAADLTSMPPADDRARYINTELRSAATQLRAKIQLLPYYDAIAFVGLVPKHKDLDIVASELVRLSNIAISIPLNLTGRERSERVQTANDRSVRSIETIQERLNLRTKIL